VLVDVLAVGVALEARAGAAAALEKTKRQLREKRVRELE